MSLKRSKSKKRPKSRNRLMSKKGMSSKRKTRKKAHWRNAQVEVPEFQFGHHTLMR